MTSAWPAIAGLLFLGHVWLVRDVMQNGDCAVYNEQIDQHLVGFRTTHVGYILVGILAHAVSPLPTDVTMNLVCLAFAAAGGGALYAIARRLGATRGTAAMAPLLAFALHAYLRGAVLAEVDVPSCSLVLVATALWVSGRAAFAGIAFGAGMLVTPVTATALPIFLLTTRTATRAPRAWRTHLRDLAVFAGASLVVYAPLVIAYHEDYFYGGRGLFKAAREPWSLAQQLDRSWRFFTASATPWFAVGIAAVIAGVVRRTPLALGVAAATLLTVVAGDRTLDVPVQLPQLCLLAAFVVVLVRPLPRCARIAALACFWLMTAVPTYIAVADEVRDDVEKRDVYRAMIQETPKMVLAGVGSGWEDGLRFERIAYGKTKIGLGMSYRDLGRSAQTIVSQKADHAIWLLKPPPDGAMKPFAGGWHPATRILRGAEYEVWLPN